jgi:hypothetical protein
MGQGIVDSCLKEGALFSKANLLEIDIATKEQAELRKQFNIPTIKRNACSSPVVRADQLALQGCVIATSLSSLSFLPASTPALMLAHSLGKSRSAAQALAQMGVKLNPAQRKILDVAALAGPKEAQRVHAAMRAANFTQNQIEDLAAKGVIPPTARVRLLNDGVRPDQIDDVLKKMNDSTADITEGNGVLDDATLEILHKIVNPKTGIMNPKLGINDGVIKLLRNYRKVFPGIKDGQAVLDPDKAFTLIKKFHDSDSKGLESLNKIMDEVAADLAKLGPGATLDQSKAAMRAALAKYVDEATGKPLTEKQIEKLIACPLSAFK